MYAVIDLETTGLRTDWHDRVVEIAVVHVDGAGRIEREWSTLVNPGRDLGPQHVHRVRAADARRAPTFKRLAGTVAGLLRGRAVVAHNLAFDGPFLAAEYARFGSAVPLDADTGLCTMRLAAAFLPTAGRSLRDCCRAAGVDLYRAHAALDDARAAAGLLGHYLARAGQPPPWSPLAARSATAAWPPFPVDAVEPVHRRPADKPEPHFLSRLVDRLPRLHRPDADAYLDLLDRALVGRHISATHADALVASARELGLGRAEVRDLHARYLRALADAALADADGGAVGGGAAGGPLVEAEHRDLVTVAVLLGLPPSDVDDALVAARRAGRSSALSRFRLATGDTVVFTGMTAEPRASAASGRSAAETAVKRPKSGGTVWEDRARAAGLLVGDTVTRRTRLLVAADPDTMSGKADRAHRYGIPVVHPAAFAALLDAMAAR